MAVRNRVSYGRDQSGAQYRGYAYGNSISQQLVASRDPVLGVRDVSRGRREEYEPQYPRRLSGMPYALVDPRILSARGGQVPSTETPLHSRSHVLNAGVSRTPYDHEQGGVRGTAGVGSHMHSRSAPNRDVGVDNYDNVSSYNMLQQQQAQLAEGNVRSMHSVPEEGGSLPGESGEKGGGIYRGTGTIPDEEKLALAAVEVQKLQQQGVYLGWPIVRDDTAANGGGWEEDDPILTPLSPQAMPMSPRREDLVSMMRPSWEDMTPPPMSPRRNDMEYMMSPRREHLSPPRSPRRKEYPTTLDYRGRLPPRRGLSPSREDDYIIQSRADYPMSPRRGAALTPPMSPRGEQDYDGFTAVSPPRMAAPMSPRRDHDTPTRSPIWGSTRHATRSASQWDVLPVTEGNKWDAPTKRESRTENRYAVDHLRGPTRTLSYRADIDDSHRLGQGWAVPGRVQRRQERVDDQDVHLGRPPTRVVGYGAQNLFRYGMAIGRPYVYNAVVNQRVGLTTKYIERERAERAAERAARILAESPHDGEPSNRSPISNGRPIVDKSRSSHSTRRNEKDTLAAAIAKSTTEVKDKDISSGGRKSKHDKSSVAPSSKSTPANGPTNLDKTAGADKTRCNKPSSVNLAKTSTVANGTAATGSRVQPASNQATKESKKPEAGEAKTENASNVISNGGIKTNGHKDINTANVPAPAGQKRPSLVMEIERAKKVRKLAEQQRHAHTPEVPVEEIYYDANELSASFVKKVNRAATRYARMLNDDPYLKRRYQGGGQSGLQCLVCEKGSKTFSDVYEVVTHAQLSQVESKRIDHMGFRKALIDVLKLDIKDSPVSNTEPEDDMMVWPPLVVVENARTRLDAEKRWEGLSTSEIALLLNEMGHPHGRPKTIWDKYGHRGVVQVEFDSSLEGLREAERLHNYFLQNGRGRVNWEIIRPFKTGLPGSEAVLEGPDFTRFDEVTKTNKRVLYGYLALKKDIEKIFSKKGRKKVDVVNRKDIKMKLLARQSGEQQLM